MKILFLGLIFGLICSCAYQPKGMVSKVDGEIYKVEFKGDSEGDVKKVLHEDAKGICKSEHKKNYFQVVEEKYDNTGLKVEKKEGDGGFMGALKSAGNAVLDHEQKDNWTGELQFKCN